MVLLINEFNSTNKIRLNKLFDTVIVWRVIRSYERDERLGGGGLSEIYHEKYKLSNMFYRIRNNTFVTNVLVLVLLMLFLSIVLHLIVSVQCLYHM